MMDFDSQYRVIKYQTVENGVLKTIDALTGEVVQEEIIDNEQRN